MHLIFEKEQWEEFKKNTIEAATDKEKQFVIDFFENLEKHGRWEELPEYY